MNHLIFGRKNDLQKLLHSSEEKKSNQHNKNKKKKCQAQTNQGITK